MIKSARHKSSESIDLTRILRSEVENRKFGAKGQFAQVPRAAFLFWRPSSFQADGDLSVKRFHYGQR